MTRKEAIKKVIHLMLELDITSQDILDYCLEELKKQTKEVKTQAQRLKSKGMITR